MKEIFRYRDEITTLTGDLKPHQADPEAPPTLRGELRPGTIHKQSNFKSNQP
jgi:hypothetical protein